MVRFLPAYIRVMIQRPVMMFAPTLHADMDALNLGNKWRGRRSRSSLLPKVYDADPLDELVAVDVEPKREMTAPEKRQSPEKKETLPTPSDVPPPTPTDVPVPEPWDIPPPDPKDLRPKSVP